MEGIYKKINGKKYYKFFLGDYHELINALIENEVKDISYDSNKKTLYFKMKDNYTLNELALSKTMRIGTELNYFFEGVYLDSLIRDIVETMKNYTQNLIEKNVDEIMIRLGQRKE